CRLNLGDRIPDHSSLTRIRQRFGEETFQRVFEHFIDKWVEAGLVSGKKLISDASLIDANASIDSMVERPDGDPDAKALKNYQQRYHDFREGKNSVVSQIRLISAILTQRPPWFPGRARTARWPIKSITRLTETVESLLTATAPRDRSTSVLLCQTVSVT
ncbi:MAG: transposase, partial [Candidatus Thiodiazotropha sp.]